MSNSIIDNQRDQQIMKSPFSYGFKFSTASKKVLILVNNKFSLYCTHYIPFLGIPISDVQIVEEPNNTTITL
jgi:hypothetical protein